MKGAEARGWLEPVDGASLAAFRFTFGTVVAFAALRYLAYGWVERFFGAPTYFLPFPFIGELPTLTVPWMKGAFALMALCGVAIALGVRHRIAAAILFVVFTYTEFVDVSNYLNHYYLVSLLSLLLVLLPADACFALAPHKSGGRGTVPRWAVWIVRFQLGTVYFYAGVAKLNPDWLLHAQPLSIWFSARSATPIVGPLFEHWWIALAASWAGCLHDLAIVPGLLYRRTRPFAYMALVSFHVVTGLMFRIGLFPLIMITSTPIFFSPSWPRALLGRLGARRPPASGPSAPEGAVPMSEHPESDVPFQPWRRKVLGAFLVAWVSFQVLMPLRSFIYGGNVLWHEYGMRWSWRVMLSEKTGSVTYIVRSDDQVRHVSPLEYLTPHQNRELSARPDLILGLAHRIARDEERRGAEEVAVFADAVVSLNGRPPARIIDPNVDLSQQPHTLAPPDWVLPAPEASPPHLHR